VSRLEEGKITSVAKKQCMVFDAFGNVLRADVIASSGTCLTTPSISINSATNRMNAPVTYDGAGEQWTWNSGLYHYWWYPTGQMRQFDGSNRTTMHGYTADGERASIWGVSGDLLASRGKAPAIVRAREIIAIVGVERLGIKVKDVAVRLGKNPGSVSRWMVEAAQRRREDRAFDAACRRLEGALAKKPREASARS